MQKYFVATNDVHV